MKYDSNYWTGCTNIVSCQGPFQKLCFFHRKCSANVSITCAGIKILGEKNEQQLRPSCGARRFKGKNEMFLKKICYFRGNNRVRQ